LATTGLVCHEHYFWHHTGASAGPLPYGLALQPDAHPAIGDGNALHAMNPLSALRGEDVVGEYTEAAPPILFRMMPRRPDQEVGILHLATHHCVESLEATASREQCDFVAARPDGR
jgi:hypothetical protein